MEQPLPDVDWLGALTRTSSRSGVQGLVKQTIIHTDALVMRLGAVSQARRQRLKKQ